MGKWSLRHCASKKHLYYAMLEINSLHVAGQITGPNSNNYLT